MSAFRWNWWNTEHIARHGVSPEEAEDVAVRASWPYPQKTGQRKWMVRGQTESGRHLQVVYVVEAESLYVIHARPLTDPEKRQLRRRRR